MSGAARIGANTIAVLPAAFVSMTVLGPLALWVATMITGQASLLSALATFLTLAPRTLAISLAVGTIAVIMGGGTALYCRYSSPRMRMIVSAAMLLPLLVGFLARNLAWLGLLLYAPSEGPAALLYRTSGVVFVMATVFVPFAYFVILQGTSSLRPIQLEAASTLGVTPNRTLIAVVLPLLSRSIVLAFCLTSVLALGYFVTPRMIGGGNADFVGNAVLILLHRFGDFPGASALGMYLLVLTSVPVVVLAAWVTKKRRQSMAERS